MARSDRIVAVLGATGFTGRLVVADLRRLRLPLRLVGRDPAALGALALPGDEVRVADAADASGLEEAFAGTTVVVSCAGPFGPLGLRPVRAAIGAGAHYLDTSAEQGFARRIFDEAGGDAAERGVCLLTSFGVDYALGDLAASLAATAAGRVRLVRVAYAVRAFLPSRGTRRTLGELMRHRHQVWVGRALAPSTFGATSAEVRFPFGVSRVVEWGGTEPLTVPRHVDAEEVRSYARVPSGARLGASVAPLLAPVVARVGGLGPAGAPERWRTRARFAVVAEAVARGGGGARATVVGRDVYGVTARLVAEAASELSAGEVRVVGAVAPAEAFAARVLLSRLAPLAGLRSIERL